MPSTFRIKYWHTDPVEEVNTVGGFTTRAAARLHLATLEFPPDKWEIWDDDGRVVEEMKG